MKGFVGFVDDAGHFALDNLGAFRAYAQKFKGQIVVLTLKKQERRQGTQSMRYYRGIVIPDICEAAGYDRDDFDDRTTVHEAMAWKHLRISDHPVFGFPRRRSTSKDDLSQEEMTAYIDKVILDAETNIVDCRITRPNEADLDAAWAPDYDSEAA